jgi:hypothetical protein
MSILGRIHHDCISYRDVSNAPNLFPSPAALLQFQHPFQVKEKDESLFSRKFHARASNRYIQVHHSLQSILPYSEDGLLGTMPSLDRKVSQAMAFVSKKCHLWMIKCTAVWHCCPTDSSMCPQYRGSQGSRPILGLTILLRSTKSANAHHTASGRCRCQHTANILKSQSIIRRGRNGSVHTTTVYIWSIFVPDK